MCETVKKLCKNLECKICFNRSFKSIDYSKNIVDKNINPRFILKFSHETINFQCNDCNHIFIKQIDKVTNGGCCPYCVIPSKILCNNNECKICFERSFISHEKAKYWDISKNKKNPREVFKKSASKYYFNCNNCSHNFEITLASIINLEQFCPYCVNQKLCNNNCKICFDKSFASNPFSKNWSNKNDLLPRDIFNKTSKKYLFNCNNCNHEFESRIADIKQNTLNCPYCANKLL